MTNVNNLIISNANDIGSNTRLVVIITSASTPPSTGILEKSDYLPFGTRVATSSTPLNRWRQSGKEEQVIGGNDLGQLDFGARHYDPWLARWTTQDPMAAKYGSMSPYNYCGGNPINLVDPQGSDIYQYDNNSGVISLYQKTNDPFDQIGQFKFNKKTGEYVLRTNHKGQVKSLISNIEKGILVDGINFKENDNVISVGGDNQPSIKGVEDFVIELSELVGLEISGYEYSMKGSEEISHIYIGRFHSSRDRPSRWNTAQKASSNFDPRVAGVMLNEVNFHVDFHTHLSSFADSDRLQPSGRVDGGGDLQHKRNQQKNGVKRFIILTKGYPPIEY